MTNIAQLGIRVESESVDTAATDLDRLVQAGTRTNAELAALNLKSREATRSLSDMAQRQLESATSLAQIAKAAVTVNHELQSLGLKQTYVAESMSDMALSSRQTVDQLELLNSRQQQSVQSMANLGSAVDRSSAEFRSAAASLREMTAQLQALAVTAPKTIPPLKSQKEQLAQLLGQIDPTVAALDRLDAQQRKLQSFKAKGLIDAETFERFNGQLQQTRTGLTDFDSGLTRTGNTAKQTAAALRNVPAQFTDIVVSLQAGQAPLTVLLQQGGQLKDMFGGIGPAASALGGYVLGLVNPFTVAAAAAAVLTLAYYQGSEEATAFEKALILSGNAAGTTADQLAETAKHISNVVGTTGQAAAALVLMAQSGKIAAENMEQIGVAAVSFSKATGTAIEDVVAQYVALGKEPVEASRKLNDQYGYLTAAVYEQITALEAQGEREQAAALAQTALADAQDQMATRVQESLGSLQRGWNSLASAAKGAWDAMLGIGREETLQTRIDKLSSFIEKRAKLGGYDNTDYERQLEVLKAQLATEQQRSKEQGDRRKQNADAIEAATKVKALTDETLSNEEKRNKKKEEYLRLISEIRKANPDSDLVKQANVDKVLANIDDKYKDPKTRTRTRRSAVDLTDLNDEQNARKALVSSYANSQKELEAQQKAGLITQEAYYRQRVVLINAEKEQVTAAYQGEIDALEQAKARSTTSAEQRIQLDQKIADARANMVKAQKDADSELSVLALNEQGRLKKQEESVRTYTDALQQQVRTLRDQGQRSAATLGMGDRQRSLYDSQNAITDRINSSRLELANQYGDGSRGMSIEEYQRKLDALKATENDLRATVVANYDDMSRAQGDWRNGVTAALQDYQDSARNIAGQTKSLVTGAFGSMEDAAVSFATTGKASFSSFATAVIGDMARIAARAASSAALSGLLSLATTAATAYLGSPSSTSASAGSTQAGYTGSDYSNWVAGQRAAGGPVAANSLYQVNELGPELLNQGGKTYLMMGSEGGSITPLTSGASAATAAGAGRAGDVRVTIVINSDGGADVSSNTPGLEQFGQEMGRIAEAKYREMETRSISQGGNINRAIKGRV